MSRMIVIATLVLVVSPSPSTFVKGSVPTTMRKFDQFGDIKCEDEYARLANFAIQLQQEPQAKGVIIFYGGKTFRDRLPKLGEAEARAARLKPYLVRRRGIPANQIIVINGGYSEEWRVDIWIVPTGAILPSPERTIPIKEIRFRKGKANSRDFRCRI